MVWCANVFNLRQATNTAYRKDGMVVCFQTELCKPLHTNTFFFSMIVPVNRSFFFFATTAAPCTGQPLQRLMDSYFKEMRWHICQVNILAQLNLWCYEITWGPLKLALLSLEINPALTFANKRSVFSLNPFFLQLPQKIKSDSYSQGNPILQSLHICRCISMLQTHKLHQNAWCDKSQCTHIRGNIIQKSWLAQ